MGVTITVLIEKLQGANAFIEHAVAALAIYIFRLITGKRGDNSDVVLAEKFRQPFKIGLQQYGEIASINYFAVGLGCRLNEVTKFWA